MQAFSGKASHIDSTKVTETRARSKLGVQTGVVGRHHLTVAGETLRAASAISEVDSPRCHKVLPAPWLGPRGLEQWLGLCQA